MPTVEEEVVAYQAELDAWVAGKPTPWVCSTARTYGGTRGPVADSTLIKNRSTILSPIRGEWTRPKTRSIGMFLHVHGANATGSVTSYRNFCTNLCAASSAYVFYLEYLRPPEAHYPRTITDIETTLDWLEAGGAHPISQTILVGDSYGATPILAAMQARRDAGRPLPAGMYFLCPKVDYSLTRLRPPPYDYNPDTCPVSDGQKGFFDVVPASDVRASPLFGTMEGLPPVLIHTTTADMLYPESTALHAKLQAAGNAVTYREWNLVPHIWPVHYNFTYTAEAYAHAGAWARTILD